VCLSQLHWPVIVWWWTLPSLVNLERVFVRLVPSKGLWHRSGWHGREYRESCGGHLRGKSSPKRYNSQVLLRDRDCTE